MRFLGVDLAWKDGNASGVALLGGPRFPLHLREVPHTLGSHRAVLDWIERHVARHRAAVGVDAPLLGLGHGRRPADNEISRAFGRFHASTHSPSHVPALDRFARALIAAHGVDGFAPRVTPEGRRPAIREVYPNALQVRLFGLDETPGLRIVKYKRRRFPDKRQWAERGLGEFVQRCAQAIGGRYVVTADPAWNALVADRPAPGLSGRELKSIEDRWDALLCALAVALEFCGPPGMMRFYSDGTDDSGAWRKGHILAPTLAGRLEARGSAGPRPFRGSRARGGERRPTAL